ncbi:hypothetical protein E3U55_09085 [Filobacillus milosensis]|uniref:Transporter n=1 Tax=Filobacillus milosensis TaxID=94137 RepID=A0A4Y8IN00_9BACI|nr:hypothetical protein [Filobacillus milosensis]TFB21455.1 hypothetical protein E3U55_09085 [Filobacillus milosensis]
MKNTVKGFGWTAMALITCPCHLVFIIPLLAGTALGSFLAEYETITWGVLGVLFIYFFYMGWKKLSQSDDDYAGKDDCTPKENEKKASLDCCSPQQFEK